MRNLNYFIFCFLCFFIISSKTINKHSCGSGKNNYKLKKVSFNNNSASSKSSISIKRILDNNNENEYTPINIYYDMTYLNNQKVDSSQDLITKIDMVDKAMSRCVKIFKKLLKIKQPLNAPIKVKSEQDLKEWKFTSYQINSNLMPKSTGISCDLVILLRFKNENEEIKYDLPEASAVYIDEYTKRPILGILIINDEFEIKTNTQDYLEYLMLHGMTHILGFSYNLFSSFPGQLSSTIIIEKEIRTNKEKYKIKTPKVLEFAKKYFGCDKITGVELENKEDNINPSHWEARLLLGEYMNSEPYTPEQAISEFTLALLEDSGWYSVNYYTGGLMRFGKNQGCKFIDKDCLTYKSFIYEVNFKNEFCDPSINWVPSCSSGRQSRSYCSTELNEIDPDFQRFGNYRGRANTDFCFVNDFYPSEENSVYYVGNCKKGMGNYGSNILYNDNIKESNAKIPESFGEKYGNNSYCVLSSVIPKIKKFKDNQIYNKYVDAIHSMCYPMFCTEKSLTIQINNQYIVCPRSGGKITMFGDYDGDLYCPDYNLICTGTVQCNDMFDCVEKESLAKNDTYIYDYKIKTSQHLPDLLRADIDEGYEESQNEGKCPEHCHQCLENKKCIKCRPDYKLIGIKKNDGNSIICKKIDITDLSTYYKDSEDNTYYKCPDNCLNCQNGGICTVCDEIHKLDNENNKCVEKVKNCEKYDKNNEDCLLCKDNYFFINEDRRNCYNVLDDRSKYFPENNNSVYYSCEYGVSHCEKCKNKRECIKCKDNYFFINEERSICYNEIDKNKYYPEENGAIYYSCKYNLPNCEECLNKYVCSKCFSGYFFINNDRTQCYNKLDNKDKYYSNEDQTIYYSCNKSIPHCETCLSEKQCTKCEDNYFFINEDRSQCFNEIDEKKYYSEEGGKIYYSCSYSMPNCIECKNKTKCLLCDENYFLSGKNSLCYPISTVPYEKCQIIYSNIDNDSNNKLFNDNIFLVSLINNYINDYKDKNYIIKHYTNNYKNYTITIFKAAICTNLLIDNGFYILETNEILKKVNLDFFYNNDNYIQIFITYGFQNFYTLYNEEINSFLDLSFIYSNISYNILNNFTYKINNLLGKEISYVIKNNKINIFNKEDIIFNNICHNFTVQGIDMPNKYRLNKLYLGNDSEEIICTSDKCKMRKLFIDNLTGLCECDINEEVNYLLNQPENIFLNEYKNSTEESDAFKIFTCYHNNYKLSSNVGFIVSIFFIIIQISTISVYFIFIEKVHGFSEIANPPGRPKVLVIEDDLEEDDKEEEIEENENNNNNEIIAFSEYSNYDEEKRKQDRDIDEDMESNNNSSINNGDSIKQTQLNDKSRFKKNDEHEILNKNKKNNINFKYIKDEILTNNNNNAIEHNTSAIMKKHRINNEESKINSFNNKDILSEEKNAITNIKKRIIKNNNKNAIDLKSSENNELIDSKEQKMEEEYFGKNNSILKINRIKKKKLKKKLEKEEEKNNKYDLSINTNNDIKRTVIEEDQKNNSIRNPQSQTEEEKIIRDVSFHTNMPEDNKDKNVVVDINYDNNNYYSKNFKNLSKETSERFCFKNKNNNINDNNNKKQNKNNKFVILFNYNEKKEEKEEKEEKDNNNSNIELNNSIIDYLPFNEIYLNDKRKFINLYWDIVSLKHPIINMLSFIKYLNISESYIPIAIKINKFLFMITLNLFINSMNISQNYLMQKYEYYNERNNIQDNEYIKNSNEIIRYAMKNGFSKAMISFIICLFVFYLIEYFLFNNRRKINNLSLENNLNINILNRKIIGLIKILRKKVIIYICASSFFMIIFSLYFINFSFAYPGSVIDYVSISIITFIFLQMIPFVTSLLICLMRYYSIKKKYKILYAISQLLL